jgi:hypothetical protein
MSSREPDSVPDRTVVRLLFTFRESLRQTTAKSLYDAEFTDADGGPDTELSVYVAPLSQLEELTLEHYAAVGNDPPRRGIGVDVAGLGPEPVSEPTSARFSLVRESHHYLPFLGEPDLLVFADRLLAALRTDGSRERFVSKDELRAWLRGRLDENSVEWVDFMNTASAKWLTYAKARGGQ